MKLVYERTNRLRDFRGMCASILGHDGGLGPRLSGPGRVTRNAALLAKNREKWGTLKFYWEIYLTGGNEGEPPKNQSSGPTLRGRISPAVLPRVPL